MFHCFMDNAALTPHGGCSLWRPDLVTLKRRSNAKFTPAPWLFAAFIILFGLNHVQSLVTLADPISGFFSSDQGFISAASAAILIMARPLTPRLLAVPSIARLATENRELAGSKLALRSAAGGDGAFQFTWPNSSGPSQL